MSEGIGGHIVDRTAAGDARIEARPERRLALDAVASSLAKMICDEWGADHDMKPEAVAADLRKHIAIYYDGYELAKRLEDREYWLGVDAQLVELLDNAYGMISQEHDELVRAWVRGAGVTCPFSPGQRVRIRQGEGVVVETPDRSLALGHVHVRTPEQRENAAWVVNYEDAALLSDGAPMRQDETVDAATGAQATEGTNP